MRREPESTNKIGVKTAAQPNSGAKWMAKYEAVGCMIDPISVPP